ncbi:tetratricopeptide repeat-containing sensor histidine kinase [Rufibacter roseus]|uniref:histidine kinase n=1 Tax=Rufibacter roseus TaxID=1567108 RepID=A0ABW2DRN4_9BACT|nr:tetratricopeptide repeat-containing sensor histidine kinase [Rufibacter roseus]
MKRLLTTLLLCWGGDAIAQQSVIDSLRNELERTLSDSGRVVLLNHIGEQYTKFDPKKSIETSVEAEKLASKINFLKGRAQALNYRGVAYLITSEYGKAMTAHQQALKIREQINDSVGVVNSYVNLGNTYFRNNEIDKALSIYKQGITYAQRINDKKGLSRFYNNIGSVLKSRQEFKEALPYFQKAAALKEELNDKRGYAVSLQHIGGLNAETGALQKALENMNKSLLIYRELEDLPGEINVLRDISDVYRYQKNYTKALEASKRSLSLAQKINSTLDVALSADQVHEIYALQGNYRYAYENLLIRSYATDTLHSNRRRALVAEAEAKYEAEKRDLENQKLLAEQEHDKKELAHQAKLQQLNWIAWGATLSLFFVLSFSWFKLRSRNRALKVINKKVKRQNHEIYEQKNSIEKQERLVRQQRDELEKLNAFKNKIFSIISHDLRSPFASVQALFYLADNNSMNDQEFKRLFQMLGKDYDNATNLLDNLLVWAKSQMAGASITYEQLNVQQLAEESVTQMMHSAELKQITLFNAVPASVAITSDHERLNFVVRNLVMNAIKFTPAGGSVTIGATDLEKEVIINVTDTGKGMTEKEMSFLFTEKRYSTAGTLNEKGTGLGLLLCRELLESINASITVESEVGKGSTFYLRVPKPKVENLILKGEAISV